MAPVFMKRYGSGGIKYKPSILYGVRIDQTNGDTDTVRVSYLEDCKNFIPGYMDFSSLVFNYGSWADAWPFKDIKPCILNNDGSVYRYLDPNKYSQDISGAAVEIGTSCAGNVMVGIPRIFWKINRVDDNITDIYVSDGQPDDGFYCWSHINAYDDIIDRFYMAAYNTYTSRDSSGNNVIRSISGVTPCNVFYSQSAALDAAKRNHPGGNIWFVESYCDYILITILLLLIGRSVSSQLTFGQGITGSYNKVTYQKTGILDGNGLFYSECPKPGVNNIAGKPVKTLGIENWWGHVNRYVTGFIRRLNTEYLVKMTYGKADGSTVEGFNDTGDGYIVVPTACTIKSIQASKMEYNRYGFVPLENVSTTSGTVESRSVLGYCDGYSYFNNGRVLGHGKGVSAYSSSATWPFNGNVFGPGMFYMAGDPPTTSTKMYHLVCRPAA